MNFIKITQILQSCAVGSTITALSAVVFISMVQSYNFMLMVQSYNFVFQILLTLKKKQWCKAVGSSITALSAAVFIHLKDCCLLRPRLPEAPCITVPVLKLMPFWHCYFILLISAEIVYCCARLHIY